MKYTLLLFLTLAIASVCGCSGDTSLPDRPASAKSCDAFYADALEIAKQSRDGYFYETGPWMKISPSSEAEVRKLQATLKPLEEQLASYSEKQASLNDENESLYTEYPLLREIIAGTYRASRKSDGIYDINSWTVPPLEDPPKGLNVQYKDRKVTNGLGEVVEIKKELWQVRLTPDASKALDAIEENIRLINDSSHDSNVAQADYIREQITRQKNPSYCMTVADAKRLLGEPDSIIKHDYSSHIWVYRFSNGAVEISLDGDGDLDKPGTIIYLNSENINKL
jgi:hypothetical protein